MLLGNAVCLGSSRRRVRCGSLYDTRDTLQIADTPRQAFSHSVCVCKDTEVMCLDFVYNR